MQAKDIKHGAAVTVTGSLDLWEVLDRHPKHNCWWIHRRGTAGEGREGVWITGTAHVNDMHPAGDGSRQEFLLTVGLAA
jgi:hypothetical protein